MNIILYTILGIIQGIAEPLPISSSGHIVLFKNIFNVTAFDDLNFEIIVNFASFIAILFIFRKDIIKLLNSFFKYLFGKKENKNMHQQNFKYCIYIIISTIPTGIIGLLFKDAIENKLSHPQVVGIAFLITATALFLVKNLNGHKKDKDITYKDAIIIGLFQMCALFPGISRSGAVLVGCLLCKFDKDTALKYTFILYFPVSLASFSLSIFDIFSSNIGALSIPYLSGFIFAGGVTYFTYQWFSKIVKKGKLWKFSIYCLLVGLFTLIYFR